MTKSIFGSFLALAIMLFTTSCDDDTTQNVTPSDPLSGWTKVGEASDHDGVYTVELYAQKDLFVGYQKVTARVYNLGKLVTDANVVFEPMMTMATMEHSCPSEQPAYVDASRGYEGAITFIMESGMMGTWEVTTHVDHDGNHVHMDVPVMVMAPDEDKLLSWISPVDSTVYFMALVEPMNPEVGENDYQVALYKRQSMMDFPAVEGFTMTIEPEMPTMGHGSPNNVDPMEMENGHYKGVVNFTMTGMWYVHNDVYDGDNNMVTDGQYFQITF